MSEKDLPDPDEETTEEPTTDLVDPKQELKKKKKNPYYSRLESTVNFDYPRLRDVIMDEELHKEVEQIITGITNRDVYEIMGGSPGHIYVMSGPPGSGKSFSVKAIRNEIYDITKKVHWAEYNIGDQGTAYINMGARNLRKFYDGALAHAKEDGRTSIIFHDEIDILLGARGNRHASKEDDKITNEAMLIWQEIQDIPQYSGVYVFGATNFPEAIDKAAMRSGRVDRHVKFKLPGIDERKRAFQLAVRQTMSKAMYKSFDNLDYQALAKQSDGCNYADITQCVKNALNNRAHDFIIDSEGVETIAKPPVVTTDYVSRALDEICSSKEKKRTIGFVK